MGIHTDHRETSDTYRGELFRQAGLRVIVCRDGQQWILQRQRGGKEAVGAGWDALGYFTTLKALARVYREKTGVHPSELANLPERINTMKDARINGRAA